MWKQIMLLELGVMLATGRATAADPPQPLILKGHDTTITSLTWSHDGTALASADDGGRKDVGTIRIWDAITGKEKHALQEKNGGVFAASWSPDGKTLATGSFRIRLWDPASGTERSVLEENFGGVMSLAWSPDGKTLASGDYNGAIRLWDPQTKKQSKRWLENPKLNRVDSLTWSPDGKFLVSSCRNKQGARLSSVEKEAQIDWHGSNTGFIQSVAWNPDGKVIAAADDKGCVWLWDAQTKKDVTVLKGHSGMVTSIGWRPDGKVLASGGGDDKTIRLWNPVTGKEIATLNNTCWVEVLAWRPDGKALATAGSDNAVRVWQLPANK